MVFMLLTFVGQAYAAVIMPYAMSMSSMQVNNASVYEGDLEVNTMDMNQVHSNPSQIMVNDEHQTCTCHCNMEFCSSVALPMDIPLLITTPLALVGISQYRVLTLNQYPSSLYRPPIFA